MGEVVLYWASVEQARHEHMPDECKYRYIIQCCGSLHPGSIEPTQDHHMVPTELMNVGKVKRINKWSPKHV